MLRIFHDTHYDFIRWWKTAVIITAIFVVAGVGSLLVKGINYSIDGTLFSRLGQRNDGQPVPLD